MNYRNTKLLALARGESCANCEMQDDTTVAAHSNLGIHGKGKSLKAHDCFIAFLCYRCHCWLDQGRGKDPTQRFDGDRQGKLDMFTLAMDKTMLRLWQSGRIKVAA